MFRNYVPHEDPGLKASARFLLKLRLIRVQGLLDMEDEHNLPYLRSVAKDPARVATVKRVLEYGWVQCGTSLEETFRSYGITTRRTKKNHERSRPMPHPHQPRELQHQQQHRVRQPQHRDLPVLRPHVDRDQLGRLITSISHLNK